MDSIRNYYKAQQMFGAPEDGRVVYSSVLTLNLEEIEPSVAGPKRPQDRIPLSRLKQDIRQIFAEIAERRRLWQDSVRYGKALSTRYGEQPGAWDQKLSGGGAQASETIPIGHGDISGKNTSIWTETEMINNRPSPDVVGAPREACVLTLSA